MAYANLNNTSNFQLASFGQRGFDVVTSTTPANDASGNWNSILVLEDAVITATSVKGDSLSSVSVPAGVNIVGLFTAVSVTQGVALAYMA